jgi:hypothetical protein
MNISFLQRAFNKSSLKFSALRKSTDSHRYVEFSWDLLTFFITFMGQASCEANMNAFKTNYRMNKKVKKFKTHTMYSFANNLIYPIN